MGKEIDRLSDFDQANIDVVGRYSGSPDTYQPEELITYPRRNGKATVIYVEKPRPEYRGDDLLRRFVPYFVLSTMSMILLGGLAALLGMIIPPILALVITLVGSLVSIILSLVVTIIAGVIAAVGIGYLQTINRKIDREEDQ